MTDAVQNNEEDEISLLDLLQVLADNLRLLVLAPLATGLLALGISFSIPPTFTASTKFLPPQQQQGMAAAMLQSLGALGGLAGAATGLKNPNDQYVALLKSRTLQDAVIDRFNLTVRYKVTLRQQARQMLENKTAVRTGKDNLIEIATEDSDPAIAAELANAYVEELQRLLGRLALTEAQQRRLFFETQLQQTRNKMVAAEQALKSTGINSSALKSSPQAAIGVVAQLQAQISAQEIKMASMRGYLAESAPAFRQAITELSALRAQLARFEKTEHKSGDGSDTDYIARYRDFKYYETLFELFAKQFELAKVDESREGAFIQVVDIALAPENRSKPKRSQIAVLTALVTGIGLLLFVFARHALRNAMQTPESAARLALLRASVVRAMGRSRG